MKKLFTTSNMAVMGVLSAISYIFYMFVKIKLTSIFPFWLELQISDLPALLGGFAINPLAAVIIIVIKCVLKMPFSDTFCVGELTDILVGIAFVLPASLIYHNLKSKKSAVIGMIFGSLCAVALSTFANWFVIVPFYAELYGGFDKIVSAVSALYNGINENNFYSYYLPLAVVPFNLLRCALCSVVTYFIYKPLSKYLHWEHNKKSNTESNEQC